MKKKEKTSVKKILFSIGVPILIVILILLIWQMLLPRESNMAFLKTWLYDGNATQEEMDRVNQYVQDAYVMIEAKKYDDAIDLMTKAIKLYSGDHETYLLRGYAYTYKLDIENAEKDYKKALELAPESYMVNEALADLYFNKQEFEKAAEYYDKSIELKSDNREAKEKKIMSLMENEDYDAAIKCCEELYNADKSDIVAMATMGDCYYHKKDYEKALDIYDEAVASCQVKGDVENLTKLYLSVGTCYLMNENYDKAIQFLTEYINTAGTVSLDAYLNRGIAYYNHTDYTNTIADMTVVIENDYEKSKACLYRGMSYYSQYEYESAADDLEFYLEENPDSTDYYINLAVSLDFSGEKQEAKKWYLKSIQAEQSVDLANYNVAFIYFEDNEFEISAKYFTYCIEHEYNLDYAYYNRGMCYYYLKDYYSMYEDLTKMVDITKDEDMKENAQDIINGVIEQGIIDGSNTSSNPQGA